eukprot:SAG11_NODE_48_length_20030_cov_232.459084_4_plen_92_part_00
MLRMSADLQGIAVERLIDDEFDRALAGVFEDVTTSGSASHASTRRKSVNDRQTFADMSHPDSLVQLLEHQPEVPHNLCVRSGCNRCLFNLC